MLKVLSIFAVVELLFLLLVRSQKLEIDFESGVKSIDFAAPEVGPVVTKITFPPEQLNSLLDIYNSMNGAWWIWKTNEYNQGVPWNFTGTPNPCEDSWQGIECASCTVASCNIQALELNGYNLTGSIPESVRNLTALQVFEMAINNITGTLPVSLSWMKGLKVIHLQLNELSGTIPASYGNLTELVEFDVSGNALSGSIPEELTNCTNLYSIKLFYNYLTGPIPKSIGNLWNLTSLNIHGNLLSNTIPASLYTLHKLQYLFLDTNNFNGSIADALGGLYDLSHLSLYGNSFTGSIPCSISNITHLYYLWLNQNAFTGSPNCIFNQTHLYTLDFAYNYFSGSLSSKLAELVHLDSLLGGHNLLTGPFPDIPPSVMRYKDVEFNHNSFTGTLPAGLFVDPLRTLEMSSNMFTGSISANISSAPQLEVFELSRNLLTGPFPASMVALRIMHYLNMGYNLLTGSLGNGIGSPVLVTIYVNNNAFTGTLPAALSALEYLALLYAQSNFLTGTVPSLEKMEHLQILQLNDNRFTGNLNNYINARTQTMLSNIDISNNFFTGQIPVVTFGLNNLVSFTASTNCFTGQIPENICEAKLLESLALDGLATASRCRHYFFSGLGITTFWLKYYFTGGIPQCVYNMSSLQTLHMSGNGLTGTIPGDVSLNPNFNNIALSHNALTGTIPLAFQTRQWVNLDLGYNRLTGLLSESIPEPADDAAINLEVNRLSGDIPSSLKYAANISILTGNLFDCSTDRSELPVNDEDAATYQCGSDAFNRAMYLWLGLFFVVAVVLTTLLLAIRNPHSSSKLLQWMRTRYADNCRRWFSIYDETIGRNFLRTRPQAFQENVLEYGRFSAAIRRVALLITLYIVFILLPLYLLVTYFVPSYTHEYAYTAAATFFSGITPTIALLVSYSILVLLLYTLFQKYFYRVDLISPDDLKKLPKARTHLRQYLLLALVVLVDLAVMIPIDITYVYITVTYNETTVVLTQMSLAVFKLAWNDIAVRGMIRLAKKFYNKVDERERERTVSSARGSTNVTFLQYREQQRERREILFLVYIILLNNITIPCLAIAGVSTDCFYNLLFQAPSVTSSFSHSECEAYVYSHITNDYVCAARGNVEQSTSYEPPFIYSYQCSSVFTIQYSTVYVYMFILIGIINPLLRYLLTTLYYRTTAGSVANRILDMMVDFPLKRLRDDVNVAEVQVFDRQKFIVRINNHIAILITYGVFCPPLAVIICVGIFTFTYLEQLTLGRFIYYCGQCNFNLYDEVIQHELNWLSQLLPGSFWIIVVFSTIFYAYFVFDPIGDALGWHRAVWAPIVMVSMPLALKLYQLLSDRITPTCCTAALHSTTEYWRRILIPGGALGAEKEAARRSSHHRQSMAATLFRRTTMVSVPSMHTHYSESEPEAVELNPVVQQDNTASYSSRPLPSPAAETQKVTTDNPILHLTEETKEPGSTPTSDSTSGDEDASQAV